MPKKRRQKVLFVETQLDRALGSTRSQARFMHEFLDNFPALELVSKEVHSREDLRKFLALVRRDRSYKVVHVVAHGRWHRKKSALILTDDESIDLSAGHNLRLFRRLPAEVLLFSCCELGADRELMRRIARVSGADAVFSYADRVTDYQAFVIEMLFYHLAYGRYRGRRSRLDFAEVYERLKFSLEHLGIDGHRHALTKPLFVADFC